MLSVWDKMGKSAMPVAAATVQQQKEYLLSELRAGYSIHHKLKHQTNALQAEVTVEYLSGTVYTPPSIPPPSDLQVCACTPIIIVMKVPPLCTYDINILYDIYVVLLHCISQCVASNTICYSYSKYMFNIRSVSTVSSSSLSYLMICS